MTDLFQQGIDQFNQGDFYACHDTLEAIWMEATTAEKPFYQGILQVAVGLYHLGNHNWRGAAMLMGEGLNRLGPFEPSYAGVDVSDLRLRSQHWLMGLHQAGEAQVQALAATILNAAPPPDDWTVELPAPQILRQDI